MRECRGLECGLARWGWVWWVVRRGGGAKALAGDGGKGREERVASPAMGSSGDGVGRLSCESGESQLSYVTCAPSFSES